MATLYDLKEKLAMLGQQLRDVNDELSEKASNPAASIEEVQKIKSRKAELQERFNIIKADHDRVEAEEKEKMKRTNIISSTSTDEQKKIRAKAEFYRASIQGRPMNQEASEILNTVDPLRTDPTDTGGENFLPTNLQTELVAEPFTRNPLREIMRVTNIKGLELPKIAYSIDDDDFIDDSDTAQELELTGDKVSFGRFKSKVKAEVSDSVIYGSDVQLVNWVENALRSGLAAKEKKVALATETETSPIDPTTERHMSFYATAAGSPNWDTLISEVSGEGYYEAITNAIAALHEDYRENARVVMTYSDYVTMLKDLSNNAATLYNAPPEQVIGKPVTFTDRATIPIVGDFNYAHLNYDGQLVYDTDKDVDKGVYMFVLTAWIDMQILLKSAFRLAIDTA